jgi:CelD/BcsL family acetyltransferase involved in cellulose biosynthesis
LWPGWIQAWWRAFGRGQLSILAVYDDNDRLAAIVPMQQSKGVSQSLTNEDTPLFGFLALDETAMKALARALFSEKPGRIDLSFLSPVDTNTADVLEAANEARYRVFTEYIPAAPYVATDMSWQDYESGLRRKFRSELRRRRRRLEEEGNLELEIFNGSTKLGELLEEGFRVEGSGWKGDYGTSINSSPRLKRFYTEVAHWAAGRGWLKLAYLRLNGRTLAFDLCFEVNNTHYLLKTGYDAEYSKSAPGMILRYLMLRRAFCGELDTYDFLGAGYNPWKQEWTSTQQERLFLRVFAPTPFGLLRQTTFTTGRWGLEVAKSIARSPIVGEHRRRRLKRVYGAVHAKLRR